eukprot:PLAT15137.1.p1 GENE.PLAT15137.1~~PLAT15137.1.p1  ORF type:complete len:2194 (+),score=1373.13 PLAT15137.1:84-6584(+)
MSDAEEKKEVIEEEEDGSDAVEDEDEDAEYYSSDDEGAGEEKGEDGGDDEDGDGDSKGGWSAVRSKLNRGKTARFTSLLDELEKEDDASFSASHDVAAAIRELLDVPDPNPELHALRRRRRRASMAGVRVEDLDRLAAGGSDDDSDDEERKGGDKDVEEQEEEEEDASMFTFKHRVADLEAEELEATEIVSEEFDVDAEAAGTVAPGFDVAAFEAAAEAVAWTEYNPEALAAKPLKPLDAYGPDARLYQLQNVGRIAPEPIQFIWMDDLKKFLKPRQIRMLGGLLMQFVHAEVLGLRNAGLTSLDGFQLPNLLYAELSNNELSDVRSLVEFASFSPDLQVLNVVGNPLCTKKKHWFGGGKPQAESEAWQICLDCRHLSVLNGKDISAEERAAAIDRFGGSRQLAQAHVDGFHAVFTDRAADVLTRMRGGWDPSILTSLNLSGAALTAIFVGSFVNLRALDASDNAISSLAAAGLPRCKQLRLLNLSNNALAEEADISELRFCVSLQRLWLVGNPLPEKYRRAVINMTAHLPGNNRCHGLWELDGAEVLPEERIAVMRWAGALKRKHVRDMRQKLNLQRVLGRHELLTQADLRATCQTLIIRDAQLVEFDLSEFPALRTLDLSGNALKKLHGLRSLQQLRLLDLSCNKLKEKKMIKELKAGGVTTLVAVSLARNPSKVRTKDRERILAELGPTNRQLRALEGQLIPPLMRTAVLKRAGGMDRAQLDEYRLNLGLTLSAAPLEGRSYHPEDVVPGVKFRQRDVTELLRLTALGLTSRQLLLSPYLALQQINLSYNRLDDISNIGLQDLPVLTVLDVSYNNITGRSSELGDVLEALRSLEVFLVQGNPCMKRYEKARLAIIGNVPRMRETTCDLRVIDSEVTVGERCEAWRKAGGSESDVEKLRADAALYVHTPRGAPVGKVTTLELDGVQLRHIDLSAFYALRKLRLRNNRLESLSELGLDGMGALEVLDLRDNALDLRAKQMSRKLVPLLSNFPKLRYLGLSGNKGTTADSYRVKLLSLMAERVRDVASPLRYLDDCEIGTDEIVRAQPRGVSNDARERLRFELVVTRALQGRAPDSVRQLDVSNSGLTWGDFTPFTALRRLDVSGNAFRSRGILNAGLKQHATLLELNVSNNAIGDMRRLAQLIDSLPALTRLACAGNKVFSDDSPKLRAALLKRCKRNRELGFALRELNGTPVTLDERVEALLTGGGDQLSAERVRLKLTLEEMDVDGTEEKLVVHGRSLAFVGDLAAPGQFDKLHTLDLSSNVLTELLPQRLHLLPQLSLLDLRDNQLGSLDEAVEALEQCHTLRRLFLVNCTADRKATKKVSVYEKRVFHRLKGLESLDGVVNPSPLTEIQVDCVNFLHRVAHLSINALVDVDLRGAGLKADIFPYVLAALRELPLTTVQMSDNPWDDGVGPGLTNYRIFVVTELGDKLEVLDGTALNDDERGNSVAAVDAERQRYGASFLKSRGWAKHRAGAWQVGEKVEKTKKGKEWSPSLTTFSRDKAAMAKRAATGSGGAGGEVTGVKAAAIDGARDVAVKGAGYAAGSAGALAAVGSTVVMQATGTLLNKLEIIIGFFQIYGLVLVLNIEIPWPEGLWEQFMAIYKWLPELLNIDLELLVFANLNISLPAEQLAIAKFAGVNAVPALLQLAYYQASRIEKKSTVNRFVTRWKRTRSRSNMLLFLFLVLAIVIPILVDSQSLANVSAGQQPEASTNTIIVLCGGVILFFYLLFHLVAYYLRRGYRKSVDPDGRQGGREFQQFWAKTKRGLQRLMLFLITVSYMPVAKIVLSAYADESNQDVLQKAGCTTTLPNSNGTLCCVAALLTQPCLSVNPTLDWPQIAGFVFIALYILGTPIFFIYLIRRGLFEVDQLGYQTKAGHIQKTLDQVQLQLAEMKKVKKKTKEQKQIIRGLKVIIREQKEKLHNLWASSVKEFPKAQSYLYSSYSRKMRFTKILQMMEKLLLVLITLFVAQGDAADASNTLRLVAGNIVIAASALFAIIMRPFNDGLEDLMDIVARVGNFANVGIALALKTTTFMTPQLATFGLFLFNGANAAFAVFGLLATPIRACLAARKYQRQLAMAREAASRGGAALVATGDMAAAAAARAAGEVELPPIEIDMDDVEDAGAAAASAAGSAASAAGSAASAAAGAARDALDEAEEKWESEDDSD